MTITRSYPAYHTSMIGSDSEEEEAATIEEIQARLERDNSFTDSSDSEEEMEAEEGLESEEEVEAMLEEIQQIMERNQADDLEEMQALLMMDNSFSDSDAEEEEADDLEEMQALLMLDNSFSDSDNEAEEDNNFSAADGAAKPRKFFVKK